MKEITFIRHAESAANRSGIWNGRSDGSLSPEGETQLESLRSRLGGRHFDVVVSSPLERAVRTAESFSDDFEIDDELVEIDLGRWEGWEVDRVRTEDGEALTRAITDRTSPMGGSGESLNEAGERILNAIEKLVASMPEDSHAAVVTHGGLLQTVLHQYLPGKKRRVHAFVDNTSLTRIAFLGDSSRLASFNDTGHLGPLSRDVNRALAQDQPVLALIRHGRTRANVEQRWQGQGDWDLDELGYRQAEALGAHYGRWPSVFTSPLMRARNTAEFVSLGPPAVVPELKEIHMGHWEGMTADEIENAFPGVLEKIYRDGHDLKRGVVGESWSELTDRFSDALHSLETASGKPTVVVAHGGAIRSYISSLTATRDTYSESLFTPPNTSITHVALTDRGPLILDFAVSSHVDGMED